jgi:CBS-domain-containing membrane protein
VVLHPPPRAAGAGRPALRPDDRLDRALELFAESNLLALPVVDGAAGEQVIGIVQRAAVSSTYLRHVHGDRAAQAGPAPAP